MDRVDCRGRQRATAKNPDAAKLKNPVKSTPSPLPPVKRAWKIPSSVTAKTQRATARWRRRPPSPDLIDAKDHGSTDGGIFTNIKEGIGPKFDMKPMKAKMMDPDIWNVINYLHSLSPKTK